MSELRFCLQCDDGTQLVHGTRDLDVYHRGHFEQVSQVAGWHCPVCGDCQFDAGEAERYDHTVTAFVTRVDKQEGDRLRAIRKQLQLTQADAGRLFGGGETAFSEYERGKTLPHRSTVMLMNLLGKYPHLLSELRGPEWGQAVQEPSGAAQRYQAAARKGRSRRSHSSV